MRDGRLLGRGAADMKGPLAAMAAALVALDGVLGELGGAAVLAAVVDEEMESLGAEALMRSGLAPALRWLASRPATASRSAIVVSSG